MPGDKPPQSSAVVARLFEIRCEERLNLVQQS
jgi:hypothetical protein